VSSVHNIPKFKCEGQCCSEGCKAVPRPHLIVLIISFVLPCPFTKECKQGPFLIRLAKASLDSFGSSSWDLNMDYFVGSFWSFAIAPQQLAFFWFLEVLGISKI